MDSDVLAIFLDVLDMLDDLGYTGPLSEENNLAKAVDDGQGNRNVMFTRLVCWLCHQLGTFSGVDSAVHPLPNDDESDNFLKELNIFLVNFGCPYDSLNQWSFGKSLGSKTLYLTLLDYLCTELQALRVISFNSQSTSFLKWKQKDDTSPVEQIEALEARNLKIICLALGLPKPSQGVAEETVFAKIEDKVRELLTAAVGRLPGPLLHENLSAAQQQCVEHVNARLQDEYRLRRQMLLQRLDVTVQSFKWSDSAKRQDDAIAAKFLPMRRSLSVKSDIIISDMLAAREDLLRVEKFSSGAALEATRCRLQKIKIPQVPDRGGRAMEMGPPPPEMPPFQQRQTGRGGNWRGGESRGSWRGGRGGSRGSRGGHSKQGGRGQWYGHWEGHSGPGSRHSAY